MLDGTAKESMARALFPTVEFVQIDIEQNLEVIQATGFGASKRQITDEKRDGEIHRSEIGNFASVIGGAGFLITNKKAEELGINLPASWEIDHFANIRGKDIWKDRDTLVVWGRPLPPVRDVERGARAMFYDRDVEITFSGGYEKKPVGWRIKGKAGIPGPGVSVVRHPDPICDDIRWWICEGEVQQAVGRIRALHSTTRKKVYLINSCPTLPADHLIKYRKLVSRDGDYGAGGGDRLALIFQIFEGVVPLDRNLLHELFPSIFPNAESAKSTFDELGENPLIYINGDSPLKPFTFKFRYEGQRGRFPMRCLSPLPPYLVRSLLEEEYGSLSLFEVPEDYQDSGIVLADFDPNPSEQDIQDYMEFAW
jgi:hypothetical protein